MTNSLIPSNSLIGMALSDLIADARVSATYPFVDGEFFDYEDFDMSLDMIFFTESEVLRSAEVLALFVAA
jgi:hypothetical protein